MRLHIYMICLLFCGCNERKDSSASEASSSGGVTLDLNTIQWKTYSEWDNWPTFSYPDSFTKDSRSATAKGYEWLMMFNHPNGEFSVSGSPRGWLDMHQAERQGIRTPRELFLIEELTQGASLVAHDGYEIFRQDYGGATMYYYLIGDPEWGNAFDTLYFTYPAGKKDRYEDLMQAIKSRFIPSFKKTIKDT